MTDQAPGWYADPRGAEQTWRWWDGSRWTSWLSDDAAAPDPEGPEPAELGAGRAQGAEPRVALPLAVLVVVGAVVLAVVALGALVWVRNPRLPSGPEMAPPAPGLTQRANVDYDAATRTASVKELRVVLPGAPYACSPDVDTKPPLFTSIRSCNAIIHANYNAQGDDWNALFAVAAVADSEVVPGDLKATAQSVYRQLVELFFAGQQTTMKKLVSGRLDLAEPGRAVSVAAEIHYQVKGLPSTYTRMVLVMVELSDGSYAACFSLRTDDTPKATLAALNAAFASASAK